MIGDDLDVFFDLDEHALQAIVIESGEVITGIFDRPYTDALDVQGFSPSLTCKSADVAELRRGRLIEIQDTVFKVVAIEPDGTGVTRVQLELT